MHRVGRLDGMGDGMITADVSGAWKLGDLVVNRLGFGAMRLTARADGSPTDRDQAIGLVRRAVHELGVNHIDTAAFYFSSLRSANELINRALYPYPEDVVIVTKVWPARDPTGKWWWARPEQLRGQVEENLRQLGRDHLDVVNLRVPPSMANGPVGDHFSVLAELREAGLIRHLGLSNVIPAQLAEAREIAPVVCVQNPFGLGAPEEEREFLRACGEEGIAYVPFGSISGHTPGAAVAVDQEALEEIARSRGVSTARVRLAWTLHQGPHVLAIPGTGDPAHLEDNVAAGALRLDVDELARLEPLPEPEEDDPYEVPLLGGFGERNEEAGAA